MVELIEIEDRFDIKVGWTDLLQAKLLKAEVKISITIGNEIGEILIPFNDLSEAKEFALKNFVSMEALVRGITLKTIADKLNESAIPCLGYYDSKYIFDRTRGGWFIQNPANHVEGFYNPVGSISRGKYGAWYWLRLGGLIVSSDSDLSNIKKLAVELLNGKKDLHDTVYAWQSRYLRQQLAYLNQTLTHEQSHPKV
jgi:hypothetical protein